MSLMRLAPTELTEPNEAMRAMLSRLLAPSAVPTRTLSTVAGVPRARLLSELAHQRAQYNSAAPHPSLVSELERLRSLPWQESQYVCLAETFSKIHWKNAAATDMFVSCMLQATNGAFSEQRCGGLRMSVRERSQLEGLHCWLCRVRLQAEPAEQSEYQLNEMLAKLWESTSKDTGAEPCEVERGWHAMADGLDRAIATMPRCDARESISEVLLSTVYASEDGGAAKHKAVWLADYLIHQMKHHRDLRSEEVIKGAFTWAPPPPPRARPAGGLAAAGPAQGKGVLTQGLRVRPTAWSM